MGSDHFKAYAVQLTWKGFQSSQSEWDAKKGVHYPISVLALDEAEARSRQSISAELVNYGFPRGRLVTVVRREAHVTRRLGD